ncbi:MAG: C45 family peptidase [Syntrophales bacterium]|nr:C45 family peptidase [Syntrophales bacterium]
MKIRIRSVLILSMLLLVCVAFGKTQAVAGEPALKPIAKYDGGLLYKAGKFNVVELHGNFRQMGRQYGHLLKDDLKKFYKLAIVDGLVKEKHLDYKLGKYVAAEIFSRCPQRFREIFYGIAETSGMELEKLLILNELVTLAHIMGDAVHCSFIATWGDYSADGTMITGRHFDYPELFNKFADFVTVAIYNPTDGSVPTATVGFLGGIEAVTVMNRSGLFAEVNDGTPSGGNIITENRILNFIQILGFLFNSSDMTQLDAAMFSSKPAVAILLNVADENVAYSYEWPTFGIKRRGEDKPGLLVSTNHFVDPSWWIAPPPGDIFQTFSRRANLLALGEKYKGKFSVKVMMKVLDTPYDKGGAQRSHNIYETIFVPKSLKLWVKTLGTSGWEAVDLARHFDKKVK